MDDRIVDTGLTFKGHPVLLGPSAMNRTADALVLTHLDRFLYKRCYTLYRLVCDIHGLDTLVTGAVPRKETSD